MVLALGLGDGVGDEGVVVAVERRQAVEHGGLGGVGVETVSVAFACAVAGTVVAEVVAVHLAPGMVAGADHRGAAGGTAHLPGQVVVGVVGTQARAFFVAFCSDAFGLGEGADVDERFMAVGAGDVSECEFAEVDTVGQLAQDLVGGPGAADRGAKSAFVENAGDGGRAEAVLGVKLEYQAYDRSFVRVRNEFVSGLVDEVAERSSAAFPEPFRGFAFHAVDNAVDDGVALELSEHAEHLHEHAAHRSGGVEWFGG
nr:hypothetical protein [Nocardia wallacei]